MSREQIFLKGIFFSNSFLSQEHDFAQVNPVPDSLSSQEQDF